MKVPAARSKWGMTSGILAVGVLLAGVFGGGLPRVAFAAERAGRMVELRCDGVREPLAVEEQQPRLSWEYDGGKAMPRGTRQAAARVIVGTSEKEVRAGRGAVWDSGWVQGEGMEMSYGGPALEPATVYWWSVAVRNADGAPMKWSAPARWMTAAGAWTGRWIAAPWSTVRDGSDIDGSKPMPVFRRAFRVRARPVQAVLRIAGLGQYWAELNGKETVAPMGVHQAWTDYKKTVTYDTYDLTGKVKAGENVLGVLLGNGMYNVQKAGGGKRYTKLEGSFGVPKLIAELRLRYADGTTEVVGSDDAWRVTQGPVKFSSTYGGEDYDGRWEAGPDGKGWETAKFRDADWKPAEVTEGPGGRMVAAIAPDVRNLVTYEPVKVTVPVAGRTVYDLGQNFAGWPEVTVEGPAGAVVRLTPGELLKPDGTVTQRSSGGPQWWSYTLRGKGKETWTPRFSYYGFRYLEVEWGSGAVSGVASGTASGTVAAPVLVGKLLRVQGRALRSDSEVVGSFASSSEMLNGIHALIVAAMHNNEMSLFTDCPHREKLGWLEEVHLVAPGLLFNSDLSGLYAATARNIADAQQADGMVPTIAPQYTKFAPQYPIFDDSPEWGSTAILGPWWAYGFSGDADELKRNYGVMRRYLGYLESKAQDGIVAYGLGDWYDIGPGGPGFEKNTSLGVTGTLMLVEDAAAMQQIALLLGHADDAAQYGALVEAEKAAFNRRFWDAQKGYYDTGSQTANAMPLALGVVLEERRAAVLAHVVADIHAHQDHVTTGEIGYPYLLRALMEAGRDDVILAMMLRKDPPSYGSQLAAGATSLTEAWDANPENSQDHFMLGGAEEWFYRGLGGIDLDLSRRAAAERVTIRPRMVEGVAWVKCGYQSTRGRIESDWQQEGGRTTMEVTIPAGVEATVVVPVGGGAQVMEGAVPAETAVGVTLVRRETGEAVYRVGSGVYRFSFAEAGR
jgi:alpha-L-rhamnosidase